MFYQRNLLNLAEYDFYKLVHIFLAFKHWERVSYIFNSERNWAQVESICRTLKTAAIQPIFWHMLTQRKLIIFKLFSQRKQCCCLIQKTVLFKIYLFGDLSLILKFSLIFSHWKCHIGKKKKKSRSAAEHFLFLSSSTVASCKLFLCHYLHSISSLTESRQHSVCCVC